MQKLKANWAVTAAVLLAATPSYAAGLDMLSSQQADRYITRLDEDAATIMNKSSDKAAVKRALIDSADICVRVKFMHGQFVAEVFKACDRSPNWNARHNVPMTVDQLNP